jgi:hypothetical protein
MEFKGKFVQVLTGCVVVYSLSLAAPAFGEVAPANAVPQPAIGNFEPDETAIADSLVGNSALSQEIADILLGICYFGLPISLALAIWLYDKRTRDRLAELEQQIDLLERIWQRNLQA